MDKNTLINSKKEELNNIQEQISNLQEKAMKVEHEIDKLYAPEVPTDMVGKFIKQVYNGTCTFMRIDFIDSMAIDDDPSNNCIRFHGFGCTKHIDNDVFISNRLLVVKYTEPTPGTLWEKMSNGISEITEDTFNKMISSYMKDVSTPYNWTLFDCFKLLN